MVVRVTHFTLRPVERSNPGIAKLREDNARLRKLLSRQTPRDRRTSELIGRTTRFAKDHVYPMGYKSRRLERVHILCNDKDENGSFKLTSEQATAGQACGDEVFQ
ncbi:hypothetical protein J6590_025529 [Homalodisca vitripennis]|nr:hypothetical protein J6590_025529 [Homalodisca vitripennis]